MRCHCTNKMKEWDLFMFTKYNPYSARKLLGFDLIACE